MLLPGLKQILNRWGQSYLIVDVNCLFVAASLREEMWLYLRREDCDLLALVRRNAEEFNIRGVDPDRELATYSGGEQAILACLLIIALIRTLGIKELQLLLCGVLESISRENRQRLYRHFNLIAQTHTVSIFRMESNQIRAVALDSCE